MWIIGGFCPFFTNRNGKFPYALSGRLIDNAGAKLMERIREGKIIESARFTHVDRAIKMRRPDVCTSERRSPAIPYHQGGER